MKLIMHIAGFLAGYVAFVLWNAQFFSGWSGWNDLEWLGQAAMPVIPNVSSTLALSLDSLSWVIGNAIIITLAGWCEWQLLKRARRNAKGQP